ncbi:MAG: ribosomal RNA small subunit methyltransferase A [Chloroflexi bacterium]|nr:ribosomal RNA small subunit methyltransferase A [Chloroflexota bacterium]
MGNLLAETRGLLRRFGLRARKGLGQHFLVDERVLETIVSAAELGPADVVIEVGPGLGILTRELAGRAGRVIAIELDGELAAILERTMAGFDNVTILNADVLAVAPGALLEEQRSESPAAAAGPLSYKVVANLPYYITSPVLRHFLEASVKPQLMVVTVQKEVAEAIAAGPGQMSLLSVSVQFYGRPEIVGRVPARCFYPAPEVDSAVLRVRLYPEPPVTVSDVTGFFKVVRAGFAARRKQIANSLALGLGLPKAVALPLLKEAGIAAQRRAETLTLDEWARLYRALARARQAA